MKDAAMTKLSNTSYLPKEFLESGDRSATKSLNKAKMCLVGVDGGATKTMAVAYNVQTGLAAFGSAGASNPESVGTAAAVDSVRRAVLAALTAVGCASSEVACCVLSIAGITSDEDSRAFEKHFTEFHSVFAVNDVLAAWASGTVCKQGVAIIAGTGSHTIGVHDSGAYCRAGGWGHIMGDEGAGYIIGLTGIRAALRCYDGRAEKTALLKKLLKYYDISSPDDMLRLVYQENMPKDKIAAFAAAMAEEAIKGDAVALGIFEEAGKELGLSARAVITRLELTAEEFPVALIGSVFKSKDLVVPSLQKIVHECAPHALLVFPSMPPAAGALLLALRGAGIWNAVLAQEVGKRVDSLLKGKKTVP